MMKVINFTPNISTFNHSDLLIRVIIIYREFAKGFVLKIYIEIVQRGYLGKEIWVFLVLALGEEFSTDQVTGDSMAI